MNKLKETNSGGIIKSCYAQSVSGSEKSKNCCLFCIIIDSGYIMKKYKLIPKRPNQKLGLKAENCDFKPKIARYFQPKF